MSAHTPTPWRVTHRDIVERSITVREHIALAPVGGPTFAFFPAGRDSRVDIQKANAAFILRASNNHDALLKVAEDAHALMTLAAKYCPDESVIVRDEAGAEIASTRGLKTTLLAAAKKAFDVIIEAKKEGA